MSALLSYSGTSAPDSESVRTGGDSMLSDDIGLRWADALRKKYAGNSAAKRIARDFGIEPRTAAAWMQGGAPYVRHLCRAAELFGVAFVIGVVAPNSIFADVADVDQALASLRRQIDDLGERIRRLDED